MKSVLISNRQKWCGKICHEIGKDENGKPIYEKCIEVRKTAPKEVPFKSYIYCSYGNDKENYMLGSRGKVIGEFICDKVDEYTFSHYEAEYRVTHVEQKAMRLSQPELIRYGKGKNLYGWHISDLKIYDKPKKLSEFFVHKKVKGGCENCAYYRTPTLEFCQDCKSGKQPKKYLTRPPQSWCYVEELK